MADKAELVCLSLTFLLAYYFLENIYGQINKNLDLKKTCLYYGFTPCLCGFQPAFNLFKKRVLKTSNSPSSYYCSVIYVSKGI